MPIAEVPLPWPAVGGMRLLEPRVFGDERGFFMESWNARDFAAIGLDVTWVQDNHSRSAAGVLRGLHVQRGAAAQDKLVRVTAGRAWDVVVDLRRGSSTFGRWAAAELSAANHRMLFVPRGCAHGFLSLAEGTEFQYKCSAPYTPASEFGVRWDDPGLAIPWPLAGRAPIVSERDRQWPRLIELPAEHLFP
jgi:dTDP-4-dehydrorhamnose 3,5-epimerase